MFPLGLVLFSTFGEELVVIRVVQNPVSAEIYNCIYGIKDSSYRTTIPSEYVCYVRGQAQYPRSYVSGLSVLDALQTTSS